MTAPELTTWMARFRQALKLICGSMPPFDMCQEWIDNVQVGHVDRLQEWAVNAKSTPNWAQGIVCIDAATTLADTPVEGENHGVRPPVKPVVINLTGPKHIKEPVMDNNDSGWRPAEDFQSKSRLSRSKIDPEIRVFTSKDVLPRKRSIR